MLDFKFLEIANLLNLNIEFKKSEIPDSNLQEIKNSLKTFNHQLEQLNNTERNRLRIEFYSTRPICTARDLSLREEEFNKMYPQY